MSTLNLTLYKNPLIEVSFDLSNDKQLYYGLDRPELRLSGYNLSVWNGGLRPSAKWPLISLDVRPFGACCGLDCWENLYVDPSVSIEKVFDPWMRYALLTLSRPALLTLVRRVNHRGPAEYMSPAYQAFANYGELIQQYRNLGYHDHMLEIVAILPPNQVKELKRVTL